MLSRQQPIRLRCHIIIFIPVCKCNCMKICYNISQVLFPFFDRYVYYYFSRVIKLFAIWWLRWKVTDSSMEKTWKITQTDSVHFTTIRISSFMFHSWKQTVCLHPKKNHSFFQMHHSTSHPTHYTSNLVPYWLLYGLKQYIPFSRTLLTVMK